MVLPLRIDRTGGTGKVQEFNPTSEVLDVEVLPSELPNSWDEFPVGQSFVSGNQVWYQGLLYSCDAPHTKTADNNPSASGNWEFVGGHLTASAVGISPVENVTDLDIRLQISSTLSGSDINLETNASGSLARYNIRLDPDDFLSGTLAGGAGLTVTGSRIEFDYTFPEILFTLSKQASDKTFGYHSDGSINFIGFDLPPADGNPVSGLNPVVPYTQTFNYNPDGTISNITIAADSDPTTEVARKTFNYNSDGSVSNIVIS